MPQLLHANFELFPLDDARRGAFSGLTQSGFHTRGLLVQRGDRFALGGHARREISGHALGLLDLKREARSTGIELDRLLAIERDAVFGAIQVKRGLAEEVL